MIGLGLIMLLSVVGPWLLLHDPTTVQLEAKLQGPSLLHPLGTDHLGRDLLARVVAGAQQTLGTALLVMLIVILLSLGIGLVAGFSGGIIDALIMRLVDVLLGVPALVLALALVGTLGPGLATLIAALSLAQVPWYVRLIRGMVVRERDRPFVLVARVHGASAVVVAWHHVIPALLGQLAVLATLDIGGVILMVTGLNFLGLGVQPPLPEWGAMLNDGRLYSASHPWLMLLPGGCIALSVLVANLLGEALRDVLDPSWSSQRTG